MQYFDDPLMIHIYRNETQILTPPRMWNLIIFAFKSTFNSLDWTSIMRYVNHKILHDLNPTNGTPSIITIINLNSSSFHYCELRPLSSTGSIVRWLFWDCLDNVQYHFNISNMGTMTFAFISILVKPHIDPIAFRCHRHHIQAPRHLQHHQPEDRTPLWHRYYLISSHQEWKLHRPSKILRFSPSL